MKCPHCKTMDLRATKLEAGLPAMGCPHCKGDLISLLHYRDWAERAPALKEPQSEILVSEEVPDSYSGLSCPKCGRIMIKYLISGELSNRIDYCSSCDEAWLDGGEWELLKALKLGTKIPTVLTDEWQRRVRNELFEENLRKRLADQAGEEVAAKAHEFREWVKNHPHRPEILFYVSHEE